MSSPRPDQSFDDASDPLWLKRILNDESEGLTSIRVIVKLSPPLVREKLWNLSRELVGAASTRAGVAGQACRLFERYCTGFVRNYVHVTPSEWEDRAGQMKQRLMLLLGVSIMLASKMESGQTHVQGDLLLTTLQTFGLVYTMQDVCQAERDVFVMIGFRIPTWTSVHKVNMFVLELGLSDQVREAAGSLMDLVDYHLPTLVETCQRDAVGSPSSSPTSVSEPPSFSLLAGELYIRTVHLMAGVVIASVRFVRWSGADVSPTLARWSRAPVCYVRWLGNHIFHFLMKRLAEHKTEKKRRILDGSCSRETKRLRSF